METAQQFVETKEEIVLGIKLAQAELKAGLGIPHDDVEKQWRAYLNILHEDKGTLLFYLSFESRNLR